MAFFVLSSLTLFELPFLVTVDEELYGKCWLITLHVNRIYMYMSEQEKWMAIIMLDVCASH